MKVSIYFDQEDVQDRGFEIKSHESVLLDNGWVRVNLNWAANRDEHLFKYVSKGAEIYSDHSTAVELDFDSLPLTRDGYETCFRIQVELDCAGQVKLEPKYVRNLKYGAEIMFGPPDFENQKAIKILKTSINK